MQNDDPRAQLLDHIENVGTVEYRFPSCSQRLNQVSQHKHRGDVEAGIRFIKDEQVGIVLECGDDQKLLLHSFRIRGDSLFRGVFQAKQFQ